MRSVRGVVQPLLGGITRLLPCSLEDEARFRELGFPAERLCTTGNIKLDVTIPLLDAAAGIIGPSFKLSSLHARTLRPGSAVLDIHVDVERDSSDWPLVGFILMIDAFTPDNGATRLVPGSHRWGSRPADVLADPMAPHPEEVLLTGPAGSIAVMNSHLWHGGTANRTARPRLAMHAFYCRRNKPQQQYQKALVSPAVQATLSPPVRALLALDDPENDRLSSGPVERSGFMK